MMSAQVFKTCPSLEMPQERWSGLPSEVQKNKFHPLQAHHNRLSEQITLTSPSSPHCLLSKSQIPEDFRQKTKHSSPSHPSTQYLTPTSPNVAKKHCAFPFFLSFLSALPTERKMFFLTIWQTFTEYPQCARLYVEFWQWLQNNIYWTHNVYPALL